MLEIAAPASDREAVLQARNWRVVLTWSPTRTRQSISAFSAPVSRSISIQRMLAESSCD
jgi:hypothetical protein